MKVRIGCVSNSSSSSFCIMGFGYSFSELPEKLLKEFEDADYDADSLKKLKDIDNKVWKDLALLISADSEHVWIGMPIEAMHEDETLSEFRARAKDLARFIFQKLGASGTVPMNNPNIEYGEYEH